MLLKIKEAKPGLTTLCGLSGDETELDLSGKKLGPGCTILLAPELEANGSLSSLTFSGAKSKDSDGMAPWIDGDSITINTAMTEANFSGKGLGHAGGAQILAAFMSTKLFQDKGSLASLDISDNDIGDEQTAKIKQICAGKSIKFTL